MVFRPPAPKAAREFYRSLTVSMGHDKASEPRGSATVSLAVLDRTLIIGLPGEVGRQRTTVEVVVVRAPASTVSDMGAGLELSREVT